MANREDDPYNRAIAEAFPTPAVDYYRTNTPYQVGSDAREFAGAIGRTGSQVLNAATSIRTPLERAGRAAVGEIGDRVGNFAGGARDFYRGFTGQTDTPPAPVRTASSPATPAVRNETIGQLSDRVRAAAPEPVQARASAPGSRTPATATAPREPDTAGTLSSIGSQTDYWKRFLPSTAAPAEPTVVSIGAQDQHPSAISEYMNSSRYRELSGRGRAGRNQINADLKGLEAADTENGRNARSAADLALRGQELNQRGALELGRWGRDATMQNQRIASEFERDQNRYAAEDRQIDKRGALDRENADYKYALEEPERNARLGRLSLESQQLGIENSGKTAMLDLQTRALGGDKEALASWQRINSNGSNRGGPTPELMEAYNQSLAMAKTDPAGAKQYYDMFVKPYIKQYAEGGVVGYADGGAIAPTTPQVNPLETMYQQYAMSTQSMGALPIQFGQFIDLMQGGQGNPGNMGMGYANGGFVDTMAKGFKRTWRNLTGEDDVAKTPAIQPAPQTQQPQPAGETNQDVARRTFGGSLRAIDEMDRQKYAQGGAIDVSGSEVLGPGTGTSDSIPAVIDGHQPAALSTGEFVWTDSATESAGSGNLKHIMQALERGDPTIVSGIIGLASKAAGGNAKAIQTRN